MTNRLLASLCNRLQRPVATTAPAVRTLDEPLPANYVATILDAQDRLPEMRRLGQPGYVHVSSLIGFCPRRSYLAAESDQRISQSVTGGHRVMWRIGRAVEAHVREQFIHGNRINVFGIWRCLCGHVTHQGHYPVDRRCERCGDPAEHYHELPLFDHEARVVGNPDLLFRFGQKLAVLEIKSMNKKQWDDLAAPLGDHVFQAVSYARLLRHNRYPTRREVSIVYITKDFRYGSPYKEFHVDSENPRLTGMVDAAFAQARRFHEFQQQGLVPPRELCVSLDGPLARECPMVAPCFNRS